MRVALRFIRRWPAMLAALMALAILAMPGRPQAQTAGESTTGPTLARYLAEEDHDIDRHSAFLHLATRYTEAVMIGLLALSQTGGKPLYRAGNPLG